MEWNSTKDAGNHLIGLGKKRLQMESSDTRKKFLGLLTVEIYQRGDETQIDIMDGDNWLTSCGGVLSDKRGIHDLVALSMTRFAEAAKSKECPSIESALKKFRTLKA